MATTPNPFSNLVVQSLTQSITAYQWGSAVPLTPQQFQDNLVGEAKAYGINWPDSVGGNEQQQITSAIIIYSIFYQGLVLAVKTQPEPSNPTPEFHDWWTNVFTGLASVPGTI